MRKPQGNICSYKPILFNLPIATSLGIPLTFLYNTGVSSPPVAPSAGPEVVAIQTSDTCARWQHEVTIGLPSQNESNPATHSQQPVSFLLKVSSQDGNFVRYIWQVLNLIPNSIIVLYS